MASHFRGEPVPPADPEATTTVAEAAGSTRVMPAQPRTARLGQDLDDTLPGIPATAARGRAYAPEPEPPRVDAVPSPAQYRYEDEPRAARGRRRRHLPARAVLALLAWACRLAAIALSVVAVLDCFSNLSARAALFNLTAVLASALPAQVSGLYVINTPFGGAFRGDFAVCAVALFVADWLLCRVRGSLRR